MQRWLGLALSGLFLIGCSEDDDGGAVVPDSEYCSEVAEWDAELVAMEDEVLTLVNQHRQNGASCGSMGDFGPAEPLVHDGALRCAARVHSKHMVDAGFFDHTNPQGQSPFDRMELAGYSFSAAGENIAQGQPDAAAAVSSWMSSDGHCANIMNPNYRDTGIGLYASPSTWTQVFGSP